MENYLVKLFWKKIGVSIACFFILFAAHAQTSVNSGGGNSNGDNGSVSYAVGQVFYQSDHEEITVGIMQPYEVFVINDLVENKYEINVDIYPNPTSDRLIIKNNFKELEKVQALLYNNNGELLDIVNISNFESVIEMEEFKPTVYLLSIKINNKEVKTFKIIKN
ncbi:MAG: T9SS type A sorting domain-containing protein [Salinivirgaceae bacterium]|jgi:hypothetical protein|nr:T9SS type A sorting domain-containing protein [Salinivirgaceae bacterium]